MRAADAKTTRAAFRIPAPAAYALSVAAHAAILLGLVHVAAPAPRSAEDVRVEVIEEAARPPPPQAPPPSASAPAPVAPAPVVALRRPAPRPVLRPVLPPPPRDAPPAPASQAAPPPPGAPPPEGAAPPRADAPVRIGISLSASTSAGGIAAPSGNSVYGQMPRSAPDPSQVKPYWSEKYVPPTQVTVLPRPIGECRPPPDEYPEAASKLGIEGLVVLVLTVDEKGAIADGEVVEDPGHGLGPAALASVRRHCRFEPARRGSETVATKIRYKVRFELP